MPFKEVIYDREKLYEEVWTDPVTMVAKRYGVSDVALAKTCKKLLVPIPPRGYWARLASGRKPPKPKLGNYKGPPQIVARYWEEPETLMAERERVWGEMQSRLPAVEPIKPTSLQDKLHPLSEKTRRGLQKAKARNTSWIPSVSGVLDISVSDSSAERAVLLFDTLIKACERRGYSVSINDHDRRSETVFQLMGESIRVSLSERATRIDHVATPEEIKRQAREPWYSPPKWDYLPSGNLVFTIKERFGAIIRHSFGDTSRSRIESRLEDFIGLLQKTAVAWIAQRRDRERQARDDEKKKLRLAEIEEARKAEERKVATLLADIQNWQKAKHIREFIEAARIASMQPGNQLACNYASPDWIKWALDQADRYDPLRASPPSPSDED